MFLRTLRRYKPAIPTLLLANVAMIVVVATNGISLVTLQPIIDRIFVSTSDTVDLLIPKTAIVVGRFSRAELLVWLVGFFLLSRFIYAFALYTQRRLMMISGEIMLHNLRGDLYRKLLTFSPTWYAGRRAGETVANLTSDLGLVQHLASTITSDLIRRPLEIPFLIGILFWLNPRLALFSLLVAPFVVGIVRLLGKISRRRSGRVQTTMADIAGSLTETIGGIRIIQAFTAEDAMTTRFKRLADEYLKRASRAYGIIAAATPLTEIVTATAIAAIILVGGREVIVGTMTPGAFFAFMAVLMATYQPVKTLVNALSEANRGAGGLERVYALLDTPASVSSGDRAATFDHTISFDHVSFQYEANAQRALNAINIEVRRGETIALVGPSGAGKSTLVAMLARFLDPTNGRILFDGTDIREFDLASLRRLIGIVTQETFLFNDSIRSNVALGRTGATDEEIRGALEAAHFSEAALDAIVGERGATLSGGERQRVAIARAILMDPKILILDEATSSLDSESEARVGAAIEKLISGRTTFVIAHRLSTVQRADRIIVMERGAIVEMGTHAELIARKGLYSKLHAIQFAA